MKLYLCSGSATCKIVNENVQALEGDNAIFKFFDL